MYFNLSSRRVLNMVILIAILLLVAWLTLVLNKEWKISEAYHVQYRSLKEDVEYWWSNKLLADVKGTDVVYNDGQAAQSLPVLVYHGLADEGGGVNPFNSINFAEHMNTLKKAGWRTITLDQFEQFVRGDLELPRKSFLLTFDDGRKDTFYPSDPVLNDLGFNAVMFAITKKSLLPTEEQSTYYMSPYELQAMEKSDHWEVESHGRDSHEWYSVDAGETIGHFYSNLFWLKNEQRLETEEEFTHRVGYDLANAKLDLEKALGKDIRAFAYPFSDYGQDTVNYPRSTTILAQEVPKHYKMAFYQVWEGDGETFNYPTEDGVMMKRIEPQADWDGQYLLSKLESGLAKTLPYESSDFGREWIGSWGDVMAGEEMLLKAGESKTGASLSLNGSWLWQDYSFSTSVKWIDGSNVVLVARRLDNRNSYGCNFEHDKVYVKTVLNGTSRNLVDADYALPYYDGIKLGVRVAGDNIECLVDGRVVLQAHGINQRYSHGGIGLEIWDANPGSAEVVFDDIIVTAI